MSIRWLLPLCSLASLFLGLQSAKAAEIRLMSANAVKEAVVELVAEFEKTTGHKVITTWSGTEALARRVTGGEAADVVLIAAVNIDRLITDGKLQAGSRANFAKSGVGVAVRSGLPKPDITSIEAIKQAVLAASSIAYSSGPSGFYIAELLGRMGISEQVKHKVKQPPSGVQVGELLVRGEADLGFQQISELQHVKGIHYLGPLPAEIQNITVYTLGIHAATTERSAAQALVSFLTSPRAAPAIRKIGMEPD